MSRKNDQLVAMEYRQRENNEHHGSWEQESYQYVLLKAGDMRAPEETRKLLEAGTEGLGGHMCRDHLQSVKYMFAAGAALASRAAVDAGVSYERAVNISDMYIGWMDEARTVHEVIELHVDMVRFLTEQVANLTKEMNYSRNIRKAVDYILDHLHDELTVEEIAGEVGLTRSYFSTLFKRETGQKVTEFILNRRIEAAKNMLTYSEMSYVMISHTLGFSSQSHFIRSFKNSTGLTPRAYRMKFRDAA